jgi:hypothetical protein
MVSLAESSIVNISMGDSAKLALAFRPGPRRQRPRSKRNLGAAMPPRTAFWFPRAASRRQYAAAEATKALSDCLT